MTKTLFEKYEHLKHLLKSYGRVGIAFSGGVDSSLLLHAACEVLSHDRVIALHGRSILNLSESIIEDLFAQCFDGRAILKIIQLNPLSIAEFVNNDSQRCYHCKKKTYTTFLEYLDSVGFSQLLDGTNKDDLQDSRPGLAVLQEFSVKTPLVDADIGKKEIRFLAKSFDLPNYNMPSNSCLATRLIFAPEISSAELDTVGKIESELKKMGYVGCRAKPQKKFIVLEIRQQDFVDISRKHNRIAVNELCHEFGFTKVLIDINGRE